jgi:hypothetical protein
MEFFNGQERTITYLRDLLDQAGWRLIAVHYDEPSEKVPEGNCSSGLEIQIY